MIVLDNTDLLQGDATSASEVDYAVFGLASNALKQLAAGQLASSKGTIYTAAAADVISVIILVNTGVAHNHVNLYIAPDAGTSRRLIPKDFQLEPGYSLHFEGGKVQIVSPTGVSGGGDPSYIMTFDNTNLAAGVLTVTHNFGHQYPGMPAITDNNGKVIIPDEITFTTANAFTVDLSSYGVIVGTWRVVVLDSGASTAADAVSDAAFSALWDGITGVAPSKNSVYDKIESLPRGNLLTNSQWMAMSGSTLENVRALPDATSTRSGTTVSSDAHLLTAGMLVKAADGTCLEVMTVATDSFTVDRAAGTDGQWYEVTPGYVAADNLALDSWYKESFLDIWRQHNDAAYTKDGSFYSIKVNSASAGGYSLIWPVTAVATLSEWIKKFAGRTVTFGCWVKTSSASCAKLVINDGSQTSSSFHTGGGGWDWLEVTKNISASASTFKVHLWPELNAVDVYFSQPMLVFGSSIGAGNYQPIPNEVIWLQVPIALSLSDTPVSGYTALNIEALSEGEIGKGIKALEGWYYGINSAAGKHLILYSDISGTTTIARMQSAVAAQLASIGFRGKADVNGDIAIRAEDANWSAVAINVSAIQT